MFPMLAALAVAAHAVALLPTHPHAPSAVLRPALPELRGEELMAALRSGGYTILLRHARTDHSFQEKITEIPVDRGAQRNLSPEGVRDAKLIGVVFRKYHIPIGEIIASPMFRARETAEMAAGAPTSSMALRIFPSTPEQAALVAQAPRAGTNRLLVTHHFVIEQHVPGITPGAIGESEAVVVRPADDGKVVLIGRILLEDWERLGGAPHLASTEAGATAAPNAVSYAGTPAPVKLPDTRAGRLVERYLDVFNSGDTTRMRAFIESSLVADPNRPTAARLATYLTTFAARAPFVVTAVRSSTEDELVLGMLGQGIELVLTAKMAGERAASIIVTNTVAQHP
jgi:phosphohistidine phosphatase SixA